MLDSDAPKTVDAGDHYIPQESLPRKIDQSGETSEEGGGYSFVFYGRGKRGQHKEEKKKAPPVHAGPPVTVELSSAVTDKKNADREAAEAEKPENVEIPEEHREEKNNPASPAAPGSKINIQV